MNTESFMQRALDHVLKKIQDAEVQPDPFPHFVIAEIFPPDFYPKLMAAIPSPTRFVPAEYPGTGFGKGDKAEAGLAYPDLGELPIFRDIQTFLRGDEFCRALLGKFSRPDGIPADKYRYFANGAREFTSVFDLQIDPGGYEILPHPDIPDKIVTFQFYLVSDASLRECGTLFCRPRNGRPARRSRIAGAAGSAANRMAERMGSRLGNLRHWLERTRLGTEIGFGPSRSWYPWRMFEIVGSAPALPNHFMAFAPNERSYHAVRMNIPGTSTGRTVLRGFIRSGEGSRNFISFPTAPPSKKKKSAVPGRRGRAGRNLTAGRP